MHIPTKKMFSFIPALCALVTPLFIHAAELPPYKLLAEGIPYIGTVQAGTGLEGYLDAFLKLGLGIAVTLAILLFVYNGVVYMTSDATGQKAAAVGAFKDIVTGLLIVFAAVMVLSQINPQLTNFGLFTSLENAKKCIQDPKSAACTKAPPTPATPPGSGVPPDGKFSFKDGIAPQLGQASMQLTTLLSCMASKVPGDVGRISSISDSVILDKKRTWEQCARPEVKDKDGKSSREGCQHEVGSLHYGGTSCIGSSYAVDFADEGNVGDLIDAAKKCDSTARGGTHNGNHVHISVGASSCHGNPTN